MLGCTGFYLIKLNALFCSMVSELRVYSDENDNNDATPSNSNDLLSVENSGAVAKPDLKLVPRAHPPLTYRGKKIRLPHVIKWVSVPWGATWHQASSN